MHGPRNALITGCSTGIGRAATRELAGRRWRVFATVRRPEDAEALREEGRTLRRDQPDAPGRIEPLLLDVTDAEAIASTAADLRDRLGGAPLRGLVHNAGIAKVGPLELMPGGYFEEQLGVNLTGPMRLTQALLPLMRQGEVTPGSRRIVMVSSISGRIGTPLAAAYNASKFGLEGMSDALRRELLPQGIDVTLIEPGAIATAIWKSARTHAESFLPAAERHPAYEHYRPMIDAVRRGLPATEARAIPAERVARVIRRHLESRRPPVRQRVGRDAVLAQWMARLLPTRWFDRLILRDTLR